MDKEDKCKGTEGNNTVTVSNHQQKENWENVNQRHIICFQLKEESGGEGC